tara:strand:+ start:96 stop:845 length:750 start_codon:yes stop_codon:yes gene_type:complete
MKVDKTILIGLVIVIIILIVVFYVLNNKKDNNDRLDTLERSLKEAGIKTVETFEDTFTGYTRNELMEMMDLYFPKSKCLLEKALTDGLTLSNNGIIKLVENSQGKVVVDGRNSLVDSEFIIQLFGILSLVYSLENDNLDDWYNVFVGVISVQGSNSNMFATYDRDHEDPYSTLVLYTSSSRPPSTNPDDFVESISLTERPTNSDGSRIRNIKYTARLQFDRNKEKINLIKGSGEFDQRVYDELVACNSN